MIDTDRTLVSIIIPTTAESARKQSLERAVQNVLTQNAVAVELIVVVNGDRYDSELVEQLANNPQLQLIRLERPRVSHARLVGLKASKGQFFCFLDDDDELLKGALHTRLSYLTQNPSVDCLVTNGYLCNDIATPFVSEALKASINRNLAISMLESNWFASAAPLFRRSTVED